MTNTRFCWKTKASVHVNANPIVYLSLPSLKRLKLLPCRYVQINWTDDKTRTNRWEIAKVKLNYTLKNNEMEGDIPAIATGVFVHIVAVSWHTIQPAIHIELCPCDTMNPDMMSSVHEIERALQLKFGHQQVFLMYTNFRLQLPMGSFRIHTINNHPQAAAVSKCPQLYACTSWTKIDLAPESSSSSLDRSTCALAAVERTSHRLLQALIRMSLRTFENLHDPNPHLQSPRILVYGPSGAGKSTMIRHIATSLACHFLLANQYFVLHARVCGGFENDWEQQILDRISVRSTLVCFEHLDLIFPTRDVNESDMRPRMIALLMKLESLPQVVVVGTALTCSSMHPEIRNYFAETIEAEKLDVDECKDLLRHTGLNLAQDKIQDASKALFHSSYIGTMGHLKNTIASQKKRQLLGLSNRSTDAIILDPVTALDELKQHPSFHASEFSIASIPKLKWADIAGQEEAKQALHEMVVLPQTHPKLFRDFGITPPIGVMLYGPPGVGKTLLAKAAAHAAQCTFISIEARHVVQSEYGESEKMVKKIFLEARKHSPSIVFIDEFQSIFGSRDSGGEMGSKLITQLLVEMDSLREALNSGFAQGMKVQRVTLIAATNVLEAIDAAFLQPGRFDRSIYIDLPNLENRKELFNLVQCQNQNWSASVDIKTLAEETQDFSAAEIINLCQQASLLTLHEDQAVVQMKHFHQSLNSIRANQ